MSAKRQVFKDRHVFILRHHAVLETKTMNPDYGVTELEHVNTKEAFRYTDMEQAFEKIRNILSSANPPTRH